MRPGNDWLMPLKDQLFKRLSKKAKRGLARLATGRMISLADKIRRQLKAGQTPKEIAAKFGTSATYVRVVRQQAWMGFLDLPPPLGLTPPIFARRPCSPSTSRTCS